VRSGVGFCLARDARCNPGESSSRSGHAPIACPPRARWLGFCVSEKGACARRSAVGVSTRCRVWPVSATTLKGFALVLMRARMPDVRKAQARFRGTGANQSTSARSFGAAFNTDSAPHGVPHVAVGAGGPPHIEQSHHRSRRFVLHHRRSRANAMAVALPAPAQPARFMKLKPREGSSSLIPQRGTTASRLTAVASSEPLARCGERTQRPPLHAGLHTVTLFVAQIHFARPGQPPERKATVTIDASRSKSIHFLRGAQFPSNTQNGGAESLQARDQPAALQTAAHAEPVNAHVCVGWASSKACSISS